MPNRLHFPAGQRLIALAVIAALVPAPASAEKRGGVLRIYNSSNPPSASIHEEATVATVVPFAPIFSNLITYDPGKPRNGFDTIVPELAESWAWDAGRTKLTFKLADGVKWHDGKPFTAQDVQCTFHRLNGKDDGFYRRNPRRAWYTQLAEVTTNGDREVTFHMRRPQPSFLAMLASGFAPIYPCHVPAKDMRIAPIGTGPFKFVEFKSNDSIKLARNPDYWRKGYPLLDEIHWRIMPSRSTRVLAFTSGEFDMTFVGDITAPLLRDVTASAKNAICQMTPTNVPINVIINRAREPFGNEAVRRAVALTLDRQAFIDIIRHRHLDAQSADRHLGHAA